METYTFQIVKGKCDKYAKNWEIRDQLLCNTTMCPWVTYPSKNYVRKIVSKCYYKVELAAQTSS